MEIGIVRHKHTVNEELCEAIRDVYFPIWRFVYWNPPAIGEMTPALPLLHSVVWDEHERAFVEDIKPDNVDVYYTVITELPPEEQEQYRESLERRWTEIEHLFLTAAVPA